LPKGFASLSKIKRKEMGAKAGKISQSRGVGHAYNSITAKAAALKSVQKRKAKALRDAALYLIECGFTAADLAKLELTYEQYIYYGGDKSSKVRLDELKERVDATR